MGATDIERLTKQLCIQLYVFTYIYILHAEMINVIALLCLSIVSFKEVTHWRYARQSKWSQMKL